MAACLEATNSGPDLTLSSVVLAIQQCAQRGAAARQARANRPDRQTEYRGGLLIGKALEADQQNYPALVLGNSGERAIEIAQRQRRCRIG